MEKQLNIVLKLSLEEMALRRVVVNLWNEADILKSIGDFRIAKNLDQDIALLRIVQEEEWKETVEEEVKDKASRLSLPEKLKKRMMHMVRPVGLQIKGWKLLMEEYLSKDVDAHILEELRWTSAGAIDYQKTAEKLVCLETFEAVQCYKLACLHCLADDIPVLWGRLSQEKKRHFYDEADFTPAAEMLLEIYWAHAVQGEEAKLEDMIRRYYDDLTLHQYAFGSSACEGNKAATEFFFQKLSDEERDDCLITTVCDVVKRCTPFIRFNPYGFPQRNLCDVFCYLLPFLGPEQQMHVFEQQPAEVLACFMNWPVQDLCLDVADFFWTFLPEVKYYDIATYIHQNIELEGYYFPNLIQEFFRRSPRHFRKHFLRGFHRWFSDFSYAEDEETLQVVFRNMDLEGFLLGSWFFDLFTDLMFREKWHLVGACLREAALSRGQRQRLKETASWIMDRDIEDISEERGYIDREGSIRSNLQRCFESIDETEASAWKSVPAKRCQRGRD